MHHFTRESPRLNWINESVKKLAKIRVQRGQKKAVEKLIKEGEYIFEEVWFR